LISLADDLDGLKMTEIQYNPLSQGAVDGREFEFLELKNTGNSTLNLSQCAFVNGVQYVFSSGAILQPGHFVVLASNKNMFKQRYLADADGEFDGQLANNGERLVMVSAMADTILNIRYNDKPPWPETPDSLGYSLVSIGINPTGDQNDPSSWRASYEIGGSPGADDIASAVDSSERIVPDHYSLGQNFPNPFNDQTTITCAVPLAGRVRIKIFDVLGQEVETLTDQYVTPGYYRFVWSGSHRAAGLYFYRLEAQQFSQTRKLLYLK
jgi:hypothetical protein